MIFFKGYKTKKQLQKEIVDLKSELAKVSESKFEDYFNENTKITTHDGFAIEFSGKKMVEIFANNFWDMVVDSENYIICDLNSSEGKSVEVIIKKKGKLSPQEKLKKVKVMLSSLLAVSDKTSDIAKEVCVFLNKEYELEQKFKDSKLEQEIESV